MRETVGALQERASSSKVGLSVNKIIIKIILIYQHIYSPPITRWKIAFSRITCVNKSIIKKYSETALAQTPSWHTYFSLRTHTDALARIYPLANTGTLISSRASLFSSALTTSATLQAALYDRTLRLGVGSAFPVGGGQGTSAFALSNRVTRPKSTELVYDGGAVHGHCKYTHRRRRPRICPSIGDHRQRRRPLSIGLVARACA